jgi:ankyrin repeat protein
MWNRDSVARELIARGADLEKRDRFGWTPLIEAAMGGALETVQVLVEAGADLESDNSGTPLAWAAHRGKIAVIEYLASRGALIDPPLLSPLLNAIYMGQFEAVQVLVRLGAQRERPQWSWSRGALWNALDFARSQREPDARIIALLEAASRQQV